MAHLPLNQDPIKVHYNKEIWFSEKIKIWLIMSSINLYLKKYIKHFYFDSFEPKNKVKPKY